MDGRGRKGRSASTFFTFSGVGTSPPGYIPWDIFYWLAVKM